MWENNIRFCTDMDTSYSCAMFCMVFDLQLVNIIFNKSSIPLYIPLK
jgi:hypothetical protein